MLLPDFFASVRGAGSTPNHEFHEGFRSRNQRALAKHRVCEQYAVDRSARTDGQPRERPDRRRGGRCFIAIRYHAYHKPSRGYTHTHTYTSTYATCAQARSQTRTQPSTHTHTHAHKHARTHASTHASKPTRPTSKTCPHMRTHPVRYSLKCRFPQRQGLSSTLGIRVRLPARPRESTRSWPRSSRSAMPQGATAPIRVAEGQGRD